MIQIIQHPLSAQQEEETSARREQTAIITTVHSLIMMGHQRKIDDCTAAINEHTNSIIQNTTQAGARNSNNARQDANDDVADDNTQKQPNRMQSNIE